MRTNSIKHIKFEQVNNEHQDGIIDLLAVSFPHKNRKRLENEFLFLNYANPTQNYKPVGIIARDENKVIAYRNFVALTFILNEKKIKILVPNNTATHPDYRGMGILTKMNQLSFETFLNEFSFFFNPSSNKSSLSVNLKQKWLALGEKDYLFKLNLKSLKKTKKDIDVSFVKMPNLKMIQEVYGQSIFFNKSKISIDLSNDKMVKWLFSKDEYQFVEFNKNGTNLGYCCFTVQSKKCNLIHFDFVDSYVTISSMLNIISNKYAVSRFYYFTKKKRAFREIALLKAGFISTTNSLLRKITKKSLTPFLIRPIREHYTSSDFIIDNLDVREIANWDITKLSNF